MNSSEALMKLLESADLVRMLEDITNPSLSSQLSPAALGGIRVTLRNVRESILISHDILNEEYAPAEQPIREQHREPVRDSRRQQALQQQVAREEQGRDAEGVEFVTKTPSGYGSHQAQAVRRGGDLRASLAKMAD